MADKDYSHVPFWKKLGLKDGSSLALVRAPNDFEIRTPPTIERLARPAKGTDVILFFETRQARLARTLTTLKPKLATDGGLWVAYPKKSSKIDSDLTFEAVQHAGLRLGLVDNKSCSIDGNWSGVRFVYRLKDRPA